jgi:hypothetical protein
VLCKHEVTGSIPVGSTIKSRSAWKAGKRLQWKRFEDLDARRAGTVRRSGTRRRRPDRKAHMRALCRRVGRSRRLTSFREQNTRRFGSRSEWGPGRVGRLRGGQTGTVFPSLKTLTAAAGFAGCGSCVSTFRIRGRGLLARRLLDRIKREKGVWWMPWQQEAMKDAALCDKPGGGESTL